MSSFISMLGAQVGGQAIGQGMGMLDEALMGNRRRQKQVQQQKKLTDINVAAQEGLMDKAQQQQLEMWDATNYKAQMEQLRKAGLNPALIYAGGGGQGTTGSIGHGGVGTGSASSEAEQKQAEIAQQGMGLQMAKLRAEIKAIEASADKDNADANAIRDTTPTKVEGMKKDIEYKEASIKEITQNINNKQIQAEGMRLQNSFDRIRNDIQEGTKEDVIRSVNYSANKIHAEVNNIRQNTEINEEQRNAILEALEQNVFNLQAEYLVKMTQGKVNEEQANMIIKELDNYDRKLEQKDRDLDNNSLYTRTQIALIQKSMPGINNVIGQSLINIRNKIANNLR